MTKLPALTPDDPLRAPTSAPPPPAASSAEAAAPVTEHASSKAPPAQDAPHQRRRATRRPAPAPPSERRTPNEEWSGATDVTTFRLPAEVLEQLHKRSRDLGLAKGMTVAAALLNLFQRGDDELVQLVDQTQQRYDNARRRARRAA